MKTLKNILEEKISYNDIKWLSKEVLHDAMISFVDEADSVCFTEFDELHPEIDHTQSKLLEALLAWVRYGQTRIKWDCNDIYKAIININKSHLTKFIGRGSEGLVFDAGDCIIKIIAVHPSTYIRISPYLNKWINCNSNLTVIPHIKKYHKDNNGNIVWISMEKFQCPCSEGNLIQKAFTYCYCAEDFLDDNNARYKKYKETEPVKDVEFVTNWVRQFVDDYHTIMGPNVCVNDDIKSTNIGKAKDGRIVCFDWSADVM